MEDKKIIYLDAAASTPLDHRALGNITRSIYEDWYNPSSIYEEGKEVRRKIEYARNQVRKLINAKPEDKIIFTSCATESNNLAVQGFIKANYPNKTYVLMDYMQHPSLENIKDFIDFNEYDGLNCERMPIFNDTFGRMRIDNIETNLYYIKESSEMARMLINRYNQHSKILVPVIYVNNETGVVNNIKEISEVVHKYGGYVLADCSQAIYHIPIDVQEQEIDMLTFTSEKIGLPRGVGVLYVKDGIDIEPIIYGGHQENGLRPGTENQYMIIALGNQCERIKDEVKEYNYTEHTLRNTFIDAINFACMNLCEYKYTITPINEFVTVPNIISVRFNGYDNQQLLTMLNQYGVCCSAGSACSSGESKPSRILINIGLTEEEAKSTLRFSFDHTLKEEDICEFAKILRKCLVALKQ